VCIYIKMCTYACTYACTHHRSCVPTQEPAMIYDIFAYLRRQFWFILRWDACSLASLLTIHILFFLKHIRTLIPKSISEPLFLQKFHSVNPFNLNGNCCEPGRAQFAEEKREFPSQVVSKTCSILFSSKFGLFSNPFSGRAR